MATGVSLNFVPLAPTSDYDRDVLIPLHKAQAEAKARQAAIEAAQALAAAQAPVSTPVPSPTPLAAPVQASGAMQFIFQRESGGNPYAINASSGACGLGQALPCSKLTTVCSLSNTPCQISFFSQYANERYGGWDNAAAFWQAHAWW